MTKQEAVHQLEMVAEICTTTPLAEAALMGARALEQCGDDAYYRGKADGIRECHERLRAVMGEFGGDKHEAD